MARPLGIAAGVSIVLGVWLGPVGLAIVALWCLVTYGLTERFDTTLALMMAGCVLIGTVRGGMIDEATLPLDATDAIAAEVVVTGFARPDVSGDTIAAMLVQVQGSESSWSPGEDTRVLVKLPSGFTASRGDRLRLDGARIRTVDEFSPGYGQYLRSRGLAGRVDADSARVVESGPRVFDWLARLRREVTDGIREAIPGDAGALAAGIVTGDDSALSERANQAFLDTGTSHITAVSGSNVAMVLAIWAVVFPAGRQRRRLAVQWGIVLTVVAYGVFTGAEPPVTRAVIVAVLALFATRRGRSPDIMTLLMLSAAGIALWNPANVHLASFWLSVVASVAIAVSLPVVAGSGARTVAEGMVRGVLAAQVATVPLVLLWFGTWSVTSVLANVLLAPLMWVAFPACFLLGGWVLASLPLVPVMALVPRLVLEISLAVVHALAGILPPVTVGALGPAAWVAVALPCVAVVLVLSREGQRWLDIIAERLRVRPTLTVLAVIVPIAGIVVGAIASVGTW